MNTPNTAEYIDPEQVETLPDLLAERIRRTPHRIAYRYFDSGAKAWRDLRWSEVGKQIAQWRSALAAEGFQPGDRVALMLSNRPEWVIFDQAALSEGLIDVPLYANDRAENAAYLLRETRARLLLIEDIAKWRRLRPWLESLTDLSRIVLLDAGHCEANDKRLVSISQWLAGASERLAPPVAKSRSDLATIVYTSGTTGPPKGVMLSHGNLLWNAHAVLQHFPVFPDDLFLSVLPLSHTFERSIGCYLPIMGGVPVSFARSPYTLGEDLLSIQPTIMLTVPRIFERIYDKLVDTLGSKPLLSRLFDLTVSIGWQQFSYKQGREPWRMRLLAWPILNRLFAQAIRNKIGWERARILSCGAARLEPRLAKVFIGLGLPLAQGYGLTEASPVISANPLGDNDPSSVGTLLRDVVARVGEHDELLIKSPGVMLGYWQAPDRTAQAIDPEGWLHTGDQVALRNGHLYITGRIKEIIVLANGEKVPPESVEAAIAMDPLFDQALVTGEGCDYLSAVVVVNPEAWSKLAQQLQLDGTDPASLHDERVLGCALQKIESQLRSFPGYTKIRKVTLTLIPWTVEEGLLTPTLKLRREQVIAKLKQQAAVTKH